MPKLLKLAAGIAVVTLLVAVVGPLSSIATTIGSGMEQSVVPAADRAHSGSCIRCVPSFLLVLKFSAAMPQVPAMPQQ